MLLAASSFPTTPPAIFLFLSLLFPVAPFILASTFPTRLGELQPPKGAKQKELKCGK